MHDEDDDTEVGYTGARFGSPAIRKRLREKRRREQEPPPPVPEPRPEPRIELPPPDPEPRWPEYEAPAHSLVRPYTRTGGRTEASHDLRLETLISSDDSHVAWASPEQRPIVALCVLPRSVAEVAALMAVPLGVARILLSDLITAGLVAVHDNAGGPGQLELMERVLAGLRNL